MKIANIERRLAILIALIALSLSMARFLCHAL